MAKTVRCKICGYIMPESRLKDKCPACGVAAKAFEPYEDSLSEARRRALNLDLHPIAVHFPTTFTVSLLVAFLVPFVFSGRVEELFLCAGRLMSLFLPFLVVLAFLLGYKDGTVRFRSLRRSEVLKKKILFGSLYLASALALALVVWLWGVGGTASLLVALALTAAGLAFNLRLSLLGASVLNSAMPGR